jgi:hypothetical protein
MVPTTFELAGVENPKTAMQQELEWPRRGARSLARQSRK